tara:strand:- start:1869 stop:2066 length:198 start_codon:yes stop_codon:yes gene_type:complete
MSSINELIATSGHIAFEQGKLYERNRVARIAKEIRVIYDPDLANEYQDVVFISDLISYLDDKDYK